MRARTPSPLLLLPFLAVLTACTAGTAVLEVEPPSVDFGEVALGESSTQTVTVSNTGSASTAVSFTVSEGGPFGLDLEGSLDIDVGDSRTLFVEAEPTAVGVAAGTLQIAWTGGVEEVALSVRGIQGLPDADDDGFTNDVDCDDDDPAVNPDALDVCNAVDDNCNGVVDEALDGDGDGVTPCGPDGEDGTEDDDCDDDNDAILPGATETCDGADEDCDGAVDEDFDVDGDGYATCANDCDDGDDNVHPGATEVCNGLDEDCDNDRDEGFTDADGDGEAACTDCADDEPASFHGSPEVCDALDNDCDTAIDEDTPDSDGDGFLPCEECDDSNASVYPSAPIVCDGVLDNDCDGATDAGEEDGDADGASPCGGDCDDANAALNVADGDGDGVDTCNADCDDANASNYPGNTEACDGADNDCDGQPEPLGDGDGDGVTFCAGDCDDTDAAVYPAAPELCNGVDDDCDAQTDEGFTDGDSDAFADCVDCDDADPTTYPGAPETCDTLDDDCDGDADEDFDADGDLFVDGSVPDCLFWYGPVSVDCDDTNPQVNPHMLSVCDGIIDNDCDGVPDPPETDGDGDGQTDCAGDCNDTNPLVNGLDTDGDGVTTCAGTPDCDDNAAAVFPGATEACNGLDDDCQGGIDEDFDDDGDGYYDGSVGGCVTAYGTVDCNENAAAVYPTAPDVCDAFADNDCDNAVDPQEADVDSDGWTPCDGDCDDNDGSANLDDSDGDGFDTCESTPDCDDGDAFAYPGATEVCSGEDDNCDGAVPLACTSCRAALTADASRAGQDGVYRLDTDGAGGEPEFNAWCDMTTSGGGWTLVLRTTNNGTTNAGLITTYASWYGTAVGTASSGTHRVAGRHWKVLAGNGDNNDEIRVVHTLARSGGGSCTPIGYTIGTTGNSLTIPAGGSATYAYTAPDLRGIVNGATTATGAQTASFSASNNGPQAASCVVPFNTAPWFYSAASCGQNFPTVSSIFPSPLPTVHISRLVASDVTAACAGGAAAGITATSWYNENEQAYYVR